MPTTPYAKLLISIDNGAPASGLVTAAAAASCQLSYESTVGWPATPPPYVEIFAYPDGWSPGGDWLEETVAQPNGGTATVFRYYGATPPPAFTLPDASHWGDVLFALVVANGMKAGKLSADMTDESSMVRVESASGLWDVPYRGGRQLDPVKKWIAPLQHNLRVLEEFIATGAGGADPNAHYLEDTLTAINTNGVPLRNLGSELGFKRAGGPAVSLTREAAAGASAGALRLVRTNTGGAAGTTGTAYELPVFLYDSTPSECQVGRLRWEWTSALALNPGAKFVLSLLGTDGERDWLTVASDGAIRWHGAMYAYNGRRPVFDANGNITATVIQFSETKNALAGADSSVSFNSQKLTSVADGTNPSDAATWGQVQAVAQGLSIKTSVRRATTASITLSGAQTVDGASISSGRVLVKNQLDPTQNGLYDVNSGGAWTRAVDLTAGALAAGVFVFVEEGTTNADSGWVCTSDSGADVVGTDALAFAQFSGAGQVIAGAGLTKTGNQIDVGATDGSVQIDADGIQATGAFGAKDISTTGSITAGTAGFVGPKISRATSGVLTIDSSITGLAGTALALTGIVSIDNNGGPLDLGANTTGQTVGKSGTTWAIRGAATVAGTLGVSDVVVITKAGNGATDVAGLTLTNTTATTGGVTEQRPPELVFTGHGRNTSAGGSDEQIDVMLQPTFTAAAGGAAIEWRPKYQRAGGGWSNFGGYWTTNAPGLGGTAFVSGTIIIDTSGNGVRFSNNGNGGLKQSGTDVMLTSGGSNAVGLATNSTWRLYISSTGAITISKDTSAIERTQHGTAGTNYVDRTGLASTLPQSATTTIYTLGTASNSFVKWEVDVMAYDTATPDLCIFFSKRVCAKNVAGTLTVVSTEDIHTDHVSGIWGAPATLAFTSSGTNLLLRGTTPASDIKFIITESRVHVGTTSA